MEKYNVTYWCSWGGNNSYDNAFGGKFTTQAIDLTEIPECYNVIAVSFIVANDDHVTPKLSNSIDINKIKTAQAKNQKVIISIGGEKADFKITTEEEAKIFQDGLIAIIDSNDFEGIDIDIESGAMASNATLFGNVIANVAKHYRDSTKKDFMLTAAPEFPYLKPNDWYGKMFEAIGMDNVTAIWPQFYNQGTGWGPNVNPAGWEPVTPEKDGMAKYLAVWAWAFTTEEGHTANSDFMMIPKEKLALGIPASNGAAGDELYVVTPEQMAEAYNSIKDDYKTSVVGFMNWSADFDAHIQNVGNARYNHTAWETGEKAASILGIK